MVLFSVCLFTVLPKTSLVNKNFFCHLYSSHLTLPVYASSSFLGSWGSLIELVKKNLGPFLTDPVGTCACRTYYVLKALLELRGVRLCGEYHNVVCCNLTRIFVYVKRKMRLWKVSFVGCWIMFLRERESFTCAYIVVWWEKRERSVLSGEKGVFNGSSVS